MTENALKQIEPQERDLILGAYRRLLRSIETPMTAEEKKKIRAAFELAVDAHHEQRRKSGEPYILHPIEVARICAEEMGMGPMAIVCAILHDVVEDTPVTLIDIKEKFGHQVATIVDGLTKLDKDIAEHSPQAENFRKILQYLITDVRVVLIKLADRLHNMRTLGSMKVEKQKKIASETTFMYAPLAHRLGLYSVKTELQDLCMKVSFPKEYEDIVSKLSATEKERAKYIKDFIKPIDAALKQNARWKYRIFGRSKSISSIWNKTRDKEMAFEDIYDIFAIRIVLDIDVNANIQEEREACWNVFSLITSMFTPVQDRMKDWVSNPKSNGYESLHTTVIGLNGRFVEIQIRTERMDEVAERGFAAHWKYKGVRNEKGYDTWLNKIREILETPNVNALEFIDDFQRALFQEEVYVYTPKGDMRTLPKGATALDFAFEIHSDIGYKCQSVKVNSKLVSLSQPLKNGDIVSVTTSSHQKPTEQWLKWVTTGKARNKIRQAVKEEHRKAGEIGKEYLQRKMKNMKADFDDINIELVVKFYKMASRVDLYFAIAKDQIDLLKLKELRMEGHRFLLPEKPKVAAVVSDEPKMPFTPVYDIKNTKDEDGNEETEDQRKEKRILVVAGQNAAQYSFQYATCCNPLPREPVFAYMSTGGMRIHRIDCKNAEHLFANLSHRIMKAEWIRESQKAFDAKLLVNGVDDIGVLQKISNIVTKKLNINIKAIAIEGDAGVFEGRLTVSVHNFDQLSQLIRTLEKQKYVTIVTRLDN